MNTAAIEQAIRAPRLAETLRVWRRLCGTRIAPTRREIQPADFRRILSRLALVEILPETQGADRYRYRLMGTRLAGQDACDLTGRTLSAHPWADQRAIVHAAFEQVRATGQPVYREDVRRDGDAQYIYARLVLPLSEDGETVTHLLLARVVLGRAD